MTHCEFEVVVHHRRSGRRLLSALQYVRAKEVSHARKVWSFLDVATPPRLTLSGVSTSAQTQEITNDGAVIRYDLKLP